MFCGFLKQSTAATVLIGPVSPFAGGFITSFTADILGISKNGSDSAAFGSSGTTYTHRGSDHGAGMYNIPLSTSDTDTLGRLDLIMGHSAADSNAINHASRRWAFTVLPENTYDSLIAGTSTLLTPYAKDDVSEAHTWYWTKQSKGDHSPKIIQVHDSFDSTLAFDLTNRLSPGATINSIVSVTCNVGTVTISNIAKTSSGLKVMFDITGLVEGDNPTFTAVVQGTDSAKDLAFTGALQARRG